MTYNYKDLTYEQYNKLHDSLPHEDLITARERAGSLLKHTKRFLDDWMSKKPVLNSIGFEFIVMPSDIGMIAFIDGYIPREITISVRARIEGILYQQRLMRHAYYHDQYDGTLNYDAASLVTNVLLVQEK